MRLTRCVLLVADISGYTNFIKHRAVSLLHAEAIVTELIESVIDRTRSPLRLNKLEGDAALFYAEIGEGAAPVRDIVAQAATFFDAFANRRRAVRDERRHCSCDACAGIDGLALKAFVHVGEVAIKQVRQFEELAGEEVILVHRLMKNHVPVRAYVLVTQPVHDALRGALPECASLREEIEGLDPVTVWWTPPDAPSLKALAAEATSPAAAETPSPAPPRRERVFRHLPRYSVGKLAELWDHVAIVASMPFRRRGG